MEVKQIFYSFELHGILNSKKDSKGTVTEAGFMDSHLKKCKVIKEDWLDEGKTKCIFSFIKG